MNILITGGLGYIGSNLAVYLSNKGYKIYIIDNLSNSKIDCLKNIKKIISNKIFFYKRDLSDLIFLKKVFKKKKINLVIHLAALKSVSKSYTLKDKYFKENVINSINLFNCMINCNVKNLIFGSSASVYGSVTKNPINENFPVKFKNNNYAISKIIFEDFLKDASKIYEDFNIRILRYFNPAGAHESGILGEYSFSNSKNLFPSIARSIIKKKVFKLYNINKKKIDNTCIRDFIHITDLAEAHYHVIRHMKKKPGIDILNIGSSTGNSINKVLTTLEKYLDAKINTKNYGRRKGDVNESYASINKIKKETKWRPTRNLEDICKSFVKWIEYCR